jgi:hypothetical protein
MQKNFNIQVPIGKHIITVSKGHTTHEELSLQNRVFENRDDVDTLYS